MIVWLYSESGSFAPRALSVITNSWCGYLVNRTICHDFQIFLVRLATLKGRRFIRNILWTIINNINITEYSVRHVPKAFLNQPNSSLPPACIVAHLQSPAMASIIIVWLSSRNEHASVVIYCHPHPGGVCDHQELRRSHFEHAAMANWFVSCRAMKYPAQSTSVAEKTTEMPH